MFLIYTATVSIAVLLVVGRLAIIKQRRTRDKRRTQLLQVLQGSTS